MAIPDYQTLMRPVLAFHEDGQEHLLLELVTAMSDHFDLSPEERVRLLKKGNLVIKNRVAWAVTYLFQAGLLGRPRRGVTRITDRGRQVLGENPDRVDVSVLLQFPEFRDFRSRSRKPEQSPIPASETTTEVGSSAVPPNEEIPRLVEEWHRSVAAELLDRLRSASPDFLERAVLQLLIKMGYGGPVGDAVHLGGPGDKGLDGLVRRDPLGLDVVYVQAKRYQADHTVQRPEVQSFVGALHGAQSDRGIFITTSRFAGGATDYAAGVASSIILIDGVELSRLMVEYGCGVQARETIVLKEVDEDFFGG